MLSEKTLEELRNVRNIELKAWEPDENYIHLLDKILEGHNETADEFEDFLAEPDLAEREKQAQCIILQLKEFYQAKDAEVYEKAGGNVLMIRTDSHSFWTKIAADPATSMVSLKVILPMEAHLESFNRLARMLHNCNEDPDVGFGFFNLDDATGEVSCVYRYSFADGSFTEEGFHRYFRSLQASARLYQQPIRDMAREPEYVEFGEFPMPLRRITDNW